MTTAKKDLSATLKHHFNALRLLAQNQSALTNLRTTKWEVMQNISALEQELSDGTLGNLDWRLKDLSGAVFDNDVHSAHGEIYEQWQSTLKEIKETALKASHNHNNQNSEVPMFIKIALGLCTLVATFCLGRCSKSDDSTQPQQPTPIEQKAEAQPPKTTSGIIYRTDWREKTIASKAINTSHNLRIS